MALASLFAAFVEANYPLGSTPEAITPRFIEYLVDEAVRFLALTLAVLAPLAGAIVGAFGVGAEFETGSIGFLATRPRSRRYFIWAAWSAGLAELLVICAVPVVIVVPALVYLSGTLFLNRILALGPLMLLVSSVTFGLSYVGTVVLKSARQAIGMVVLYVVTYGVVSALLAGRLNIHLPQLTDIFTRAGAGRGLPSWQLVAGWMAVALLCPMIADIVFEDAEI